jgi:integrase
MGSWRTLSRLTPLSARNAKLGKGKKKDHLADGGGLYLQLSAGKQGQVRRSWIFRYDVAGKRTDIGLGGLGVRTLKEAREEAKRLRLVLHDGDDPLEQKRITKETKRRERLERAAELAARKTFSECVTAFLAKHQSGWKNEKHRGQWKTTLEQYANPVIGKLFVGDVETPHVVKVLEPLWNTRRVTARRLLGRIERVIGFATAAGYRTGENPARWRSHLRDLLPSDRNHVQHHGALPYDEIGALMAELRAIDTLVARALQLTILTAARTGEVTGATWAEFDLEDRTWTIPATRMKAGKEHKVPLPSRAVEVLRECKHNCESSDRIFPLHHTLMLRLLQTKHPSCTVHGFRSTFMDWAHEQTAFPKAVIDLALAHAIGDKVEAAYRRGDLFRKRRQLMDAWASHCAKPVQASATVTPMRKAGGHE